MSVANVRKQREQAKALRRRYALSGVIVALSVATYVASLNVPAVRIAGQDYSGSRLVVYGLMATVERPIIAMGLAANPLLYLAWVLAVVSFGDIAAAMGSMATVFALSSTLVHDLGADLGRPGTVAVYLEGGF